MICFYMSGLGHTGAPYFWYIWSYLWLDSKIKRNESPRSQKSLWSNFVKLIYSPFVSSFKRYDETYHYQQLARKGIGHCSTLFCSRIQQPKNHKYNTGCSLNIVFIPKRFVIFLNSASSAAALVFYLPGVCTHTDAEGK